MVDRKELIEEQVLRKVIRQIIKKVRSNNKKQQYLEEQTLRKVIQKALLLEKTAVGDEAPHEKTGINILRKTLKKVIPQIKDDYLSLTTDPAQRKSYMAHLINGIDNLLAPIETNIDAPEAADEVELEEEVDINIGTEDKFIDIGDLGLGGEEEEPEEEIEIDDDEELLTRGIGDKEHDETGRNVALGTFKQIQGTIVDDFGELANDEDRELYHDYLKTNVLLWRDRFEDVLTTNLPEPTTPEYEKEKIDQPSGEDELFEILDI
tara:strand:- start:749 stop:1540 length:792 start_codon:yes stop_codon:yes gene_type:complete